MCIGLLLDDDRVGFTPAVNAPLLLYRWRGDELQILASRETWLGDGFPMQRPDDAHERRLVCLSVASGGGERATL